MSETRILPDLQASLMCEDIRQEANGNLMLLGVLANIVVPQLPITAPKLVCFQRWTAGMGQFVELVKLVAPDQSTVVFEQKRKFELKGPDVSSVNVHVFGNVEFKEPGTHQVEVSVDDVLKLRYPVPVIVVPPKENAAN